MTDLGRGTRVKCIYDGSWLDPLGIPDSGPPFGSVWTVNKLLERWGATYFTLTEWPVTNQYFASTEFVPLFGNEDLSELESLLNKGPVDEEELSVAERFLAYVNRD